MTTSRPAPRIGRGAEQFYGWPMVVWCTIAITLTAPGQTIGVSAYVESFRDDLGLSDNTIGIAYLVGTLSGAVALPFIGRWIDRYGVRRSMFVIACVFSSAVALTGAVQGIVTLALAFAGIRMFGQGSLSLAGTTGIALWFDQQRGRAFAWSMTISAGLMAGAPIIFTSLIDAAGWRQAWVIAGGSVFAIVAPMSWLLVVDRPETLGQEPDGVALEAGAPSRNEHDFAVAESVKTTAFWSLALVMFSTGALITGMTFHHFTLMEGQGLTEGEAALVFVPQMLATLATSFVVSWLTDSVSSRILQPFSMLTLAASMIYLEHVTPGFGAVLYGVLTGMAGGAARGVFSAYYPKWFGVTHAGAIRGVASSVGVGASAVGPIMVSFGRDLTGSFGATMWLLAIFPLAGFVASALVGAPRNPRTGQRVGAGR